MLSDLPGYFIKVERTDSLVDIILQRAVRSQPNKKALIFGGERCYKEKEMGHIEAEVVFTWSGTYTLRLSENKLLEVFIFAFILV